MKVLTSRVIVFAIMSVFTMEFAKVAHATTPAADYKTVTSKAYVDEGLASKQNKITATSDGTNNTPNYVYNSSTNPTADGSVVTTTGTIGTIAQRGIATAPTYDSSNNLTNGNWLPTMGAVMGAVSAADISSHTVNGAPLSNSSSYFYGVSSTGANVTQKEISIPSITTLDTGQIIIVQPTVTSTVKNSTLKLNNFDAYPMLYNNAAITTSTDSIVWNEAYPTVWLFDGTYWRFVAHGVDSNSTYAQMTVDEGRTGTATAGRSISAKNLKAIIHGTALTPVTFDSGDNTTVITFSTQNSAIDASTDDLMTALGKLQGQINYKQNKIPATEWQDGGGANIPGVVISTGTDGVVEQRMILDKTQDITDQSISTLVANGYDEGNTGSITYDIHDDSVSAADVNSAVPTTTMTVAIANAAAATKQDEITTGLVEFNENPNYMLPAITTYDSTSGLVSNKIGILDYGTVADDNGWLGDYSSFSGYGAEMDNFVPTVRAVAEEFVMKQGVLPAKSTGDLAPRGNQAFVANTLGAPSKVYTTAGKDLAITAKSGAQRVMNYVDGTTASATFASGQGITEAQVKSTLVSLELLKDVYDRVKRPTGTTGKVVTYNGLNANNVQQFSEATIAHNLTYTTGANPTVSNLNDIASVELVLNNAGNYQPIIQPSAVSGATQIITKPAYGGTAGDISYLTLDTASLTDNNAYVPSSKLVSTQLDLKLDKTLALTTTAVNTALTGHSSTANLYAVPGAVSNGNWASTIMNTWSTNQNVPTMDTLANSLAGVYAATQDDWTDNTRNYHDATSEISGADIATPRQIAYTGQGDLFDGNQLVWLPALVDSGNEAATVLIKSYNDRKIVPTMDELAYALDGVLQTNETSDEWRNAGRYYHAGNARTTLYELANLIASNDTHAVTFSNSGYLQTFAPTLSALMDESYALYNQIEGKQNVLSGTNDHVVTYGSSPGAVGSKAIDTTVTSASSNLVTSGAVYTADLARQNLIPAAGSVRDSVDATTNTEIQDWTDRNIKGTALVSKTGADGVVGERKIFEPGDTYTNDTDTNIQIATIGAVKENTLQKTCAEYKPGTTVANQNAENCWLWTINNITAVTTTGAQACSNPRTCRNNSDCCGGYVCNIGTCVVQKPTIDES